MATMDRRKLLSKFYLVVNQITFPSTAIGALAGGRSTNTAWAINDNVVFVGELRHILIFALLAFDVASVAINEHFKLISQSKFHNLVADNDISIIDLDPLAGEGAVIDEDVLFLENLTNHYRRDWDTVDGLIVEATDGSKEFFAASTLAALAYGLQYAALAVAPIYAATNFGFFEQSGGSNGLTVVDILGASGPVEIDKAHVTLANLILSAT